jgi:hypothetical protein
MVPPFLAYYGVVNGNTSLIQEAYDQCRLYRNYLRTPQTGLWLHILWGSNPDRGLWATGESAFCLFGFNLNLEAAHGRWKSSLRRASQGMAGPPRG